MIVASSSSVAQQLYSRFFENPHPGDSQEGAPSSVTSSHWKEVGHQSVRKTGASLELNGFGFGSFSERSLKKVLTTSAQVFLSRRLLSRYEVSTDLIRAGERAAKKFGRIFDYDCIRQTISIQFIVNHLFPFDQNAIRSVCVIGDGYGFVTGLLHELDPRLNLVEVNLGRTLLFDAVALERLLGKETLGLAQSERDLKSRLEGQGKVTLLAAENYEWLKAQPIDLFINIASMQEMDLQVIQNYFALMRQSQSEKVYFYCCNRVEKKLPNGALIRFEDYPWNESGDEKTLVDGPAPWSNTHYISRPWFVRPADGPTLHRFARLK